MADAGIRERACADSPSVWRLVARFALIGLGALAIVAIITSIVSRQLGRREAIREARQIAYLTGKGIVATRIDDGLATMAPESIANVDTVVRAHVLQGSLTRVKIWRRDGTIVYSDEARLIGERFTLGADELEALETGTVIAEVSDLSEPENRYEAPQHKLLETYLTLATPGGEPLLFEAYFRYDGVNEAGRRVWLNFAPISLGALALLELAQVPIAVSMARRLRKSQRQREQLLSHAIEASDSERRRIARDLHDGVVQDLSGVSYALAAAARRDALNADDRTLLDESARRLRDGVRSLRSLLVEIYPANLEAEGLVSAIGDLLARVGNRGIETSLQTDHPDDFPYPPHVAALAYRATQEALRNVVSHADATRVTVTLSPSVDALALVIDDDGRGFDPATAGFVSTDGHVGLRALADLVGEAGGSMAVDSAPGHGTALRIEIPLS